MTESMSVENTIQLEPFKIEPDAWRRDMFIYGLWKSIGLQTGFVSFLTLFEYLVTQNGVAAAALWIYLVFLVVIARWSSFRKAAQSPLNREAWNSRQVEFDNEMLRVATSTGTTSHVPFRNFVRADEFRDKYLLFLTASQIMIFPASAFRSATDEKAFREILVRNCLLRSVNKK